jgi:type I restriction enzyme S subunit
MIDYGEGGQNVGRVSASVTRQAEAESGAHVGLHDEAANPTYVDSPIKYDLRWPVVSLAEIATKIGSGATPKGGADAYLPSRARFALVRSQNVFDRRFDHDGLAFITDEQADGLRGVVLQPNDILLNITGDGITFGRACMVPKDVLPACVNQHVSIVRLNPLRADAGYVLAYLTHPEVKSYIESFNAGGSRRAVTKGHIESFRLPLPPLPEQRAIARILGALDDKIELNRRMSETLEATARALFKSWFVDFDPVRAKAEGRATGLPKPLADLFPDSFEDSELGEIPKGWKVGNLGDVAEHPRRSVQPSDIEPTTPYIALEHMPRRCIALSEWGTADGLESNKFKFKKGEILFGKLRPYFHKVGIAPVSGVCSTDIVVVTPRSHEWFGFVLGHVSSEALVEHTSAGSTGTKMPRTSWSEIARFAVVIPPESVVRAFAVLIGPIVDRIIPSIHESHTLAALRDTLLPKLISGELRVQAAERLIEEASA